MMPTKIRMDANGCCLNAMIPSVMLAQLQTLAIEPDEIRMSHTQLCAWEAVGFATSVITQPKIGDPLLHSKPTTMGGYPIVSSPAMPLDQVHFLVHGAVAGEIVNLAIPTGWVVR